jgi:hypothetical protein
MGYSIFSGEIKLDQLAFDEIKIYHADCCGRVESKQRRRAENRLKK